MKTNYNKIIERAAKLGKNNPLGWYLIGNNVPGEIQERIAEKNEDSKIKYTLTGIAGSLPIVGTKVWSDPEIFDFIDIKRGGFLWSANNSVAVDEKFWQQGFDYLKSLTKDL